MKKQGTCVRDLDRNSEFKKCEINLAVKCTHGSGVFVTKSDDEN